MALAALCLCAAVTVMAFPTWHMSWFGATPDVFITSTHRWFEPIAIGYTFSLTALTFAFTVIALALTVSALIRARGVVIAAVFSALAVIVSGVAHLLFEGIHGLAVTVPIALTMALAALLLARMVLSRDRSLA